MMRNKKRRVAAAVHENTNLMMAPSSTFDTFEFIEEISSTWSFPNSNEREGLDQDDSSLPSLDPPLEDTTLPPLEYFHRKPQGEPPHFYCSAEDGIVKMR